MIAGSHIPFDRNGIKFYRPDGEISKADEMSIRDGLVEVPEFVLEQTAQLALPVLDDSAIELFKQRYISLFPVNMLQGKRIGIYEHSSVARDVIKKLLVHFGAEVISLECTETFVPIDTEVVSEEDKKKGLDWTKEKTIELLACIIKDCAAEGEVLEVVNVDETDGLRMTLNNGDIIHLRPAKTS
jgi:phosphomannomutase